jgi:hypothetical protein
VLSDGFFKRQVLRRWHEMPAKMSILGIRVAEQNTSIRDIAEYPTKAVHVQNRLHLFICHNDIITLIPPNTISSQNNLKFPLFPETWERPEITVSELETGE